MSNTPTTSTLQVICNTNYLKHRSLLSINTQRISNLNDWIMFRLREMSLASLTLDIEGQNTEGREFRPFSLWFAWDYFVVENIGFNLLSGEVEMS